MKYDREMALAVIPEVVARSPEKLFISRQERLFVAE